MIPRFALITTHNRPVHLKTLVSQLADPRITFIIIDNASEPPVTPDSIELEPGYGFTAIVHEPEQPPNLYRFWNVGFEFARNMAEQAGAHAWDVAVFNDDTSLPGGWYDAVSQALRASSVAAACGSLFPGGGNPIIKTSPDNDIMHRMTPHAFMVKGELDMRADETFRWWWGDTDFDWGLRQNGGVMIIPGYIAENTDANGYTNRKPELGAQTGVDQQTFINKWGRAPW